MDGVDQASCLAADGATLPSALPDFALRNQIDFSAKHP
jgi:hypothetical protein